MSATSAMKCTPQNTMNSASVCAASRESLSESPVRSRVPVHVGALVMVAEDDRALSERCLRREDAVLASVVLQLLEAIKGDGGGLHAWLLLLGPSRFDRTRNGMRLRQIFKCFVAAAPR